MCFLKLGDPLAPCDHEECKKALQALQMTQISNCLYSNPNKTNGNANTFIFKPQPQYIPKRPRPENLTDSTSNEEVLVKKLKTDNNCEENGNKIEKKEENCKNSQPNEENAMKMMGMQQNKQINQNTAFLNMKNPMQAQAIPLMANAPLNENQLLTFLLMQNNNNTNANNNQKPTINAIPAIFHEMPQPQHQQPNIADPMLNIQLQMNAFHANANNNPNNNPNNPNGFDHNHANFSNVIVSKDFLNKIYSIISLQHKVINEIKDKNIQLFDGFTKLTQEFNDFKNFMMKITHTSEENNNIPNMTKCDSLKKTSLIPTQNQTVQQAFNIIGVPGETITSRDLLHYLYAHKQEKFQYKLIQNIELDSTLYRERNFSFSVALVDLNDQPLANTNRIPLSIAIYTYENPPKCLDTNTAGSKILKGNIEKDLVNGYCSFEKIQIKEVTSHFRKGYVFLVIYPKMPTFGNISNGAIQQNFVDFTTIKPLIIEKVVVKAKKINVCRNIDNSSQNQTMQENENIKEELENENQAGMKNENENDNENEDKFENEIENENNDDNSQDKCIEEI